MSSMTPSTPPTAAATGGLAEAVTLDTLAQRARTLDTAPWLAEIRSAAFKRAGELGLPTNRDEEWRYTNPREIVESEYTLPDATEFDGEVALDWLAIDAVATLVFVDGRYAPGLSKIGDLPTGVTVSAYTAAGEDVQGEAIASVLERAVTDARDGFEAIGAGLITSGVLVRVPRGVAVGRPVLAVFLSTDAHAATITGPSVTVLAEAGSRVTVVEDHAGAADATGVTMARTELRVAADAHVEHTTLQREPSTRHHVSTLRLIQQGNSFARSNRILLGGGIVRNNIHATIDGGRAESAFNGVFVPEHSQHHDSHIRVEHMAPDCHSRQHYRGLLADRARGVFTGRIYVKDIAQKTDAIQSNSNLLLSPTAQVTAKPQLEIYADDVRCTHGATSGMFDEDALFYLRARGVPRKIARLLLLHAFVGETIDRIGQESLREAAREIIFAKLDAALERAD